MPRPTMSWCSRIPYAQTRIKARPRRQAHVLGAGDSLPHNVNGLPRQSHPRAVAAAILERRPHLLGRRPLRARAFRLNRRDAQPRGVRGQYRFGPCEGIHPREAFLPAPVQSPDPPAGWRHQSRWKHEAVLEPGPRHQDPKARSAQAVSPALSFSRTPGARSPRPG